MRSFGLPAPLLGLVFDLDSTLYSHPAYARFQTRVLVERLASERGQSPEELEGELERLRAERRARGEADTSLGNLFLALGVPIARSVAWREELIRPADWLSPDPRLDKALGLLAAELPLCLLTNNPRSVGRASLEALGVLGRFRLVVGLDDTGRSKPDPVPFRFAAESLGLPPAGLLSIGDRQDVDIAPALGLGMGGLLLASVEEVYDLPSFLLSRTFR